MNAGQVVFSLDFELGWGHRLSRPSYVERLRSEGDLRGQIGELIELFERYEIPATWAVVGELVATGADPLLHAPELFQRLLDSTVEHEIGFHSHSHEPYDRLSPAEARDDVTDGLDALEEWGCRPKTFVFPRNRVAHLGILAEAGIRCFRTARGESSFPLHGLFAPETFETPAFESRPVPVPSSVFLAARRPSWYRRRYALRGLTKASERNELVHYWLHPHNVVTDGSLMSELESLFDRVRSAADGGDVQIRTAAGLAERFHGGRLA